MDYRHWTDAQLAKEITAIRTRIHEARSRGFANRANTFALEMENITREMGQRKLRV